MRNRNKREFDLLRLAPELQVKVFEALPSPWAAVALALTCRDLEALFVAYKTQIMAAIRDNMVAPFYEYYDFLGRLHIPESGIKHPPAGGWPNITPENCSEFGKSDFVVDVLRHLPYIVEDDRRTDKINIHNIDYKCNVLDYSVCSRETFGGHGGMKDIKIGEMSHRPVTRHKVVVADGYDHGGVVLILDTSTGVIFEKIIRCCRGKTLPVQEYFALKMKQCRELRHVFVPGEDPHSPDNEKAEPPWDAAATEDMAEPSMPEDRFWVEGKDLEWVRRLYRKFGWPGKDWRKEEGLKAITEYRDRRNAEVEERKAEVRRRGAEVLQQLGPTVGVLNSF